MKVSGDFPGQTAGKVLSKWPHRQGHVSWPSWSAKDGAVKELFIHLIQAHHVVHAYYRLTLNRDDSC